MKIITEHWFHEKMMTFAPFEHHPVIAVGVSGGSDSLCLAYRAHTWAKSQGGHAEAVIINHKAREESDWEAKEVQAQVLAWGMPAYVYKRRAKKGQKNTQTAWREDRYKLLWRHCIKRNILHLLLGHHQDDVLETIHMRAKRQGTTMGLAPMASIVYEKYGRILRPFSALPKTMITKTMETLGIPWHEDPSNTNPAYERVRIRSQQQQWSHEEREIAKKSARIHQEKRKKQERENLEMMLSSVKRLTKRSIILEVPQHIHKQTLNNVLRQCLQSLGNTEYKPSIHSIDNLWQQKNATLSHCHIIIKDVENIEIQITVEKKRKANPKKEKRTPRQPLFKNLYE